MRGNFSVLLFSGLIITLTLPLQAAPDNKELAKEGTALVKKYCYRCHGEKSNGNAQFNVMDQASLLDKKLKYIVPGNLADSNMWQRIENDMPPEDQPQPTAEEKQTLKEWVLAGAPNIERPQRPHIYEEDILKTILADLQKIKQVDRKHKRYFTISHLYNNNQSVTEFDLRLYRAAFAKAINSLSWEPEIVVPKVIDDYEGQQTIFRIDLRDVGWKNDDWSAILREYPYGLKFNNVENANIRELDRQVELFTGTSLAYVRADWFTITATRPPLYHQLLRIPETDHELEKQLNVDVIRDFQRNRLKRAGFKESGVSTANRMLDRFPAQLGWYWKSYDFAPGNKTGDLLRFPLGPVFHGNLYNRTAAFLQDGGEIIFSLPNGLQGYMLVDKNGKRIDEGPISVVRDLKETSGTPVVVNGISCMHCHQHGMIRFKDTVRAGLGVFGEIREKAQDLIPLQEDMSVYVEQDRKKFLTALDEATGTFLKVDDDKKKTIDEFAEPIGAIARFHARRLSLKEAAFELGIADPNKLKTAIEYNSNLKRLGLGPLANGDKINRAEWESREFITSPMQEAARIMERATPLVFLGSN